MSTQAPRRRSLLLWQGIAALALLVVVIAAAALIARSHTTDASSAAALAANPDLDAGTSLHGPAPGFALTDQFGRRVALSSFRGKVVMLAFNDSQCTTICPLTTTEMLDAKQMLGAAGSEVQLLGVDANPDATAIADVRAYSEAHGLMHQWSFLTGSLPHLRAVWSAYHVAVQIEQGAIDHTPALYLVSPKGELARVYLIEMGYSGIRQQAQVLAEGVSALLPGHPHVHSHLSYRRVPAIGPQARASVPRAGGGRVTVGPDGRPRLLLFFDTWDAEVMSLGPELEALGAYSSGATARRLPALTAVDEASVEPSPAALPGLLHTLRHPLAYPVAIDASGQLADGYQVEDEPWLALVSPSGQVVWHYDISTSGWLSRGSLERQVRAALAKAPRAPAGLAAALAALRGSPPALSALHAQASRVVGGEAALMARLKALRGYPVVLNAWASWCPPCRSEFPLFAAAAARDGRRVAFLGADLEDQPANARSFLSQHPVSYPSYESSTEGLASLATIPGLPTTIFIDTQGKVVHVHIGQYSAAGTLEEDIATYAR